MDMKVARKNLAVKSKNGIGFILAGMVIWLIITIIYTRPIGIYEKNILMLFSTGMMFPLSIVLSKFIKADWKLEGNPFGSLGIYLNLAQLVYFPILFWMIGKHPEEAVMVFAIITGAHFFPYGWYYQTKPYSIMSVTISISMVVLGWNIQKDRLWLIPLAMLLFLAILVIWLFIDYKKVKVYIPKS